jgi:integrase
MAYRFVGKQKTLAFGVYPTVGLQDAREKRDAAKRLLGKGIDPSAQRRLERQAARTLGSTFKDVADELMLKLEREGRADATLTKKRWLLQSAYPSLGHRPIAEITAPELLSVLRKVEERGCYETARRLRSTLGTVRYRPGRARPGSRLARCADLAQSHSPPAIVDPADIGALLRAIDGYAGHPVTKSALRLAPLVFVRPGELRHAEWSEFDLEAAEWRIPAAKMKMRRPHRVPLSPQALAILSDLQVMTGHGRWLFPSVRSTSRPMSENTLNAALRRLGYGPEEMTTHGFRSMAATRLNEMGRWNPDAIERQLAHQEPDDVRRAYTHAAEYWPERVQMMQKWAAYLDGLRERGKVVALSKAKAG